MSKIINKTPHPIHIVDATGEVVKTLPLCPKEELIRLASETVSAGEVAGVPLSKTVFGEPTGLPPFQEGTYYVVSQLVKSALPERGDLLVPAEMVRDERGQIIGCRSLGT